MLTDKVIILVGATGGIGKVLARNFALAKAVQTLSARTKSNLDEVDEHLPIGARTIVVPADASKPHEIKTVFEKTIEEFGDVDAVVIAAGTWQQVSLDTPNEEALALYEKHMRDFAKIPFVVGWRAAQIFRKQGHGLIVNLSSHAALRADLDSNLTYAMAKAAGHQFMNCLKYELRNTKVRVVNIAPSTVNTPELAHLLDTEEKRHSAVQPEDIAKWIIDNFDNPTLPDSVAFDGIKV